MTGGDYLEVGFEMFDAPITNSQIESAHNEKQYIAINSTVNLEMQVFFLLIMPSKCEESLQMVLVEILCTMMVFSRMR